MNKLSRWGVLMIMVGLSLLVAVPAAHAGDFECRGTIGQVTIAGNLIVPDDATCTLNGTYIQGAIVVKSRSTLHADGPWGAGIEATGGIQAQSPREIVVAGSRLGNSVSVTSGGAIIGDPGVAVDLRDTYINGDVQVQSNIGSVSLQHNEIVGGVQASKNTGGVDISNNTIGNGLQCQDNNPAPTGGGNIAKQMQGQCMYFGTIVP
ncbi:MAG: hypothetical protein M3R24_38190 [Chloroflexota bacterium]|nr:hypothetical protein [Chloroflexota bacterium]